ncbi:MAG: cupin domain-containing protein [Fimbriimonadaceae bacterium]|nr:cupin domain-containing protein [Fimbriimonadaceae bacterium]
MLDEQTPITLAPNEGRTYFCGPMRAVFKADGEETGSRYSVSEWWVEPQQPGSGPHSHDANDELFYVTEGTMSFRVGDEWTDCPRGTFLRVPAGVIHDFRNRTDAPACVLNVFLPGGFEESMPQIVKWFEDHPEGVQ